MGGNVPESKKPESDVGVRVAVPAVKLILPCLSVAGLLVFLASIEPYLMVPSAVKVTLPALP